MARSMRDRFNRIGQRTTEFLRKLVSKPAEKVYYTTTEFRRRVLRSGLVVTKKYKTTRYRIRGAPPGEPPRMRTGALRRNIRYFVSNVPRVVWRVRVGSYVKSRRGEPYGLFLETGWMSGGWYRGFQPARPYLARGRKYMMRIAREELGAKYSQTEFLELLQAAAREKNLAIYSHGMVPIIKMEMRL